MYLFTQVCKENEIIMTGGVKLRFKSASFSIDDGYTLLNFYAQRRRTLWQLLEEGKKWIIPMGATCSLNKLPALYNFQTGRGLWSGTSRKSVIFNLFDLIIFQLEETFVSRGYFLLACNIAKNCCLIMQRAFPLPPNSPSEHLSYGYWRIRWNKLTARDQMYYKKKRTARKKTAFPSIGDSQAAIILTKHRRLNRTGRMGFWSFHYFFTKIMTFVFPPPKGELFYPDFTFLFLFHYSSSSPEKTPSSSAHRPPLHLSQKNVNNRNEVQNWFIRWEWPGKKT